MAMKIPLAILSSLALCGCMPSGPTPEQMAAMSAHRAAYQDCRAKFPLGVALAQCLNGSDARFVRPYYRYPDLLDIRMATRLSINTRIEEKKLSDADATVEWTKMASDLISEETRRDNQQQALQMQRSALIASSMPVTCTSFGATATCF